MYHRYLFRQSGLMTTRILSRMPYATDLKILIQLIQTARGSEIGKGSAENLGQRKLIVQRKPRISCT